MPGDEKVAFYLRYRQHIEEWAALREQAGRELEEALVRAVGIMRERPTTPTIIEGDSLQRPWYGIALELPGAATARVLVALGWTQSQLMKPSGESWPYIGIMSPSTAKGEPVYDTAKDLLRDAARKRQWTRSEGSWVWWRYLPLETDDTDLDAYAARQVDELVTAQDAIQSAVNRPLCLICGDGERPAARSLPWFVERVVERQARKYQRNQSYSCHPSCYLCRSGYRCEGAGPS
jgi:hypothetical protein